MATLSMAAVAPAGLGYSLSRRGLSSKSTFSSSVQSSAFVKDVKARTVCSAAAQEEKPNGKTAAKLATAMALAAIVGTAPFAAPEDALADISGLTPCKESKAFAKREKQEIKKLEGRLKQYAPDSAPALALNSTIDKTKRRFEFYGNAGLLCGTDGLPHLIVDGDQAHLGEFVYPGIVFLYIAGWIGWVGRDYLIAIKKDTKPTQKEIIIDVPLAVSLLWKGLVWPLAAIRDFRNGKLTIADSKITVSPR